MTREGVPCVGVDVESLWVCPLARRGFLEKPLPSSPKAPLDVSSVSKASFRSRLLAALVLGTALLLLLLLASAGLTMRFGVVGLEPDTPGLVLALDGSEDTPPPLPLTRACWRRLPGAEALWCNDVGGCLPLGTEGI